MDDPLVPESLKGNAKYCVYGGVGAVLLFVVITIIMTVVYGSKKGHPAWFVLALAMLGILITTCTLLNWLRQNTVEEKLKYVATAQLLLLMLLSIAAMIDILRNEVTCDPCVQVPTACEQQITGALINSPCATGAQTTNCGSFSPTPCFTSAAWNSPANGSLTIVYLNIPADAQSVDAPLTIASAKPIAAAAAPAVAARDMTEVFPGGDDAHRAGMEERMPQDAVAPPAPAEAEAEEAAASDAAALAEAEASLSAAETRLQEIADAAALQADPVNARVHRRAL